MLGMRLIRRGVTTFIMTGVIPVVVSIMIVIVFMAMVRAAG